MSTLMHTDFYNQRSIHSEARLILLYLRFLGNTFIIWLHRKEVLKEYHQDVKQLPPYY